MTIEQLNAGNIIISKAKELNNAKKSLEDVAKPSNTMSSNFCLKSRVVSSGGKEYFIQDYQVDKETFDKIIDYINTLLENEENKLEKQFQEL